MSQLVSSWMLTMWIRRLIHRYVVGPLTPQMESQVLKVEPFSEARLMDMHNVERFKAFVPPLDIDPVLTEIVAARASAAAYRLADVGNLHDGFSKATSHIERIVGENAVMGSATHGSAMDQWMDSQLHRSNILAPSFRHMGAARATSAYGVTYWYVMFSG